MPGIPASRIAALAAGLGALSCAVPRGGDGLQREPAAGPLPALFVEARPKLTATELFGALRDNGADVWIAADRRLGVRMHDAERFEAACELLARLDHEIEYLDLSYLPIASLEPLMHVRSTEQIDLTGTHAELRPLRHLTRLRSLSLAATDFDSLAVLAELRQLEQLDLHGARANLTGIGALDALRELRLSQARTAPHGFEVRDGEGLDLAALRDLDRLEILDLSQTKVRDWDPLTALWTVRQLDLSYTNFRDLGLLEQFSELESVSLRRTAVADLTPLSRLDALREIDLRDCELVEDAQLQQLRKLRPELSIQW